MGRWDRKNKKKHQVAAAVRRCQLAHPCSSGAEMISPGVIPKKATTTPRTPNIHRTQMKLIVATVLSR
jgi:hypothetical protein